jgi:uncharacterized protein YbjT (DUF2867 family)
VSDPNSKIAWLAGANGLVGNHLLDGLLQSRDFARIYAITRRPLGREHSLLANRTVQFEKVETQLKGTPCHVAFCCLGTTLQQAGSEQAFRHVDFDLVLAYARTAKAAGAQRFIFVSSVGAAPQSRHFYLRVKAQTEEALTQLDFPALDILQPGLLLGWRREPRPLELLAMAFMPLANLFLNGAREQYRAIPAKTVAAAMLNAARSGRRGVYRYTHAQLCTLSGTK